MKITFALIAIVVGLVLVNPFGADTIHQKGQVQANGITIAYESFGKPDRETILLIGGTGMLTDWPTEFCEELVSRGYLAAIKGRRTMKYICLGYYDRSKHEAMTEAEKQAMFDTCFTYDDHLRANGHWVGGELLQPPKPP
jgi:hypothetical protein